MIDPEEARRAARDILSGAKYAEPQPSLLERAVDWVFERLGDAIATLTGGGPGSVIGWLIVLGLAGAAIWLLVRALQVPGVDRPARGEGLRYGTESQRSASVWLDEAGRLAAAGEHRGALRCRYQALLATAITSGMVDDTPGTTSGEYRSLLGGRLPEHTDLVDSITRRFEDTWYGGAAVDDAGYRAFDDDCRRLEDVLDTALVDA